MIGNNKRPGKDLTYFLMQSTDTMEDAVLTKITINELKMPTRKFWAIIISTGMDILLTIITAPNQVSSQKN